MSQDKFEPILSPRNDTKTHALDERLTAILQTEETAVLIFCIYLLTQTASKCNPGESIFGPAYQATKRKYAMLSSLTNPTLELIQCGALLSLFEFGHGRAKFAYRTLSETIALARIIGVKPGSLLGTFDSSDHHDDGSEDVRAVWWGLFILDQYVTISADAKLPVD